jgi:hypothetical protein
MTGRKAGGAADRTWEKLPWVLFICRRKPASNRAYARHGRWITTDKDLCAARRSFTNLASPRLGMVASLPHDLLGGEIFVGWGFAPWVD